MNRTRTVIPPMTRTPPSTPIATYNPVYEVPVSLDENSDPLDLGLAELEVGGFLLELEVELVERLLELEKLDEELCGKISPSLIVSS